MLPPQPRRPSQMRLSALAVAISMALGAGLLTACGDNTGDRRAAPGSGATSSSGSATTPSSPSGSASGSASGTTSPSSPSSASGSTSTSPSGSAASGSTSSTPSATDDPTKEKKQ